MIASIPLEIRPCQNSKTQKFYARIFAHGEKHKGGVDPGFFGPLQLRDSKGFFGAPHARVRGDPGIAGGVPRAKRERVAHARGATWARARGGATGRRGDGARANAWRGDGAKWRRGGKGNGVAPRERFSGGPLASRDAPL